MGGKKLRLETDNPDSADDISRKMRDYLAQIYRLGEGQNRYISTSALADLVDVSAPAVNRMITRLKELDFLEHQPYQGVRLTDQGQREALKELRRQRIAEAFLVKVMGFGWHEVHDEANRISRALSETLTQRMAAMAGNPTRCPHGEPIPSSEGILPELNDQLLSEIAAGTDVEITRVRTRESDRLEYMAALGLLPGTRLHVLHVAPFHGPIQLKVGNEYRIVGHNLAELIRVKTVT
jgi:DtxR family Mn-dependent transcriptional regulator